MEQNEQELDLVKMVYSDLVSISDNGDILVKLPNDIEVVFSLPQGYPTKCPPKHKITVPAFLSDVRKRINDNLVNNYDLYAGQEMLVMCIAEINYIANNLDSESPKSDRGNISEEHVKPTNKIKAEKFKSAEKRFNWISGDILEDRKSTFQAHVVRVFSKEEAMSALAELKQNNKIGRATHNMYAYFVNIPPNLEYSDCEDDGEKGAGPKLTHMLKLMKVENMMVVVSRWYGGIHLGSDRWRHICKVAREIVVTYRESSNQA